MSFVLMAAAVFALSVPLHGKAFEDDFDDGKSKAPQHGVQFKELLGFDDIAIFNKENESRIELPFAEYTPTEGTIELTLAVYSGYYYSNGRLRENMPKALVFSTDTWGGDHPHVGATRVFVEEDGTITWEIEAETDGRQAPRVLLARGTDFRFGQFHTLSLSYGSLGMFIRLDGNIVAEDRNIKQRLGASGNATKPLNIPTIGELSSKVAENNQNEGGFEGLLANYRISNIQKDWSLDVRGQLATELNHSLGTLSDADEQALTGLTDDFSSVEKDLTLTVEQKDNLVFVEGSNGVGSGWVAKINGRFFVVTNIHVIAGNDTFTLTKVSGEKLPVGPIWIARGGYDVAIIGIPEQENYFEIMDEKEFGTEVNRRDRIVVSGNSLGEAVATELNGMVLATGYDRIEVDAKFASGNSGSPIIHGDTQKVIGIATWVQTYSAERDGLHNTQSEVFRTRWFGHRLDNIPAWDRINWQDFVRQAHAFDDLEEKTKAMITFFRSHFSDAAGNAELQRFANRFEAVSNEGELAGVIQEFRRFATADLNQLKNSGRVYNWFTEKLKDEERMRESMVDFLETAIRRLKRVANSPEAQQPEGGEGGDS